MKKKESSATVKRRDLQKSFTSLFFSLALTLPFSGCGQKVNAVKNNPQQTNQSVTQPSQSCTVKNLGQTTQITCPDGTSSTISNGRDGESCTVEQVEEGAEISCSSGESVLVNNVRDGKDGKDGQGCTVKQTLNGVIVTCGQESVVI